MKTAKNPLLEFAPQQPPLLLGLYRVIDQLLLAQREAEYQLLGCCLVGESAEHGFTAHLLADFDLFTLVTDAVRKVLTTWKYCPLTDPDRRCAWLVALLFANDLLPKVRTAYPFWQAPELLTRLQRIHTGRLALAELDTWLEGPLHLVQAGQTPILTSSSSVAAGATTNGNVGLQVDNNLDRDWLIGELLAARPEFVVLTDDLPDAHDFVNNLRAAGLQAYLYSEKKA